MAHITLFGVLSCLLVVKMSQLSIMEVIFNNEKSYRIVFGKKGLQYIALMLLGDTRLPWVESVCYLGVYTTFDFLSNWHTPNDASTLT
jgi:hypothetical protein